MAGVTGQEESDWSSGVLTRAPWGLLLCEASPWCGWDSRSLALLVRTMMGEASAATASSASTWPRGARTVFASSVRTAFEGPHNAGNVAAGLSMASPVVLLETSSGSE